MVDGQALPPPQRREYIHTLTLPLTHTRPSSSPLFSPLLPSPMITLPLAVARACMSSLDAPPLAVVAGNWAESLDAVLGFQDLVRPEGDVQEWGCEAGGGVGVGEGGGGWGGDGGW